MNNNVNNNQNYDKTYRNEKEMYIVYPNHNPRLITPKFVDVTVDDKYVLSYVDNVGEDEVVTFTELLFLDGEWYKYPFHKENYENYEFKEFDKQLSDSIIEQLPKYLYFRMLIGDSKKGDIYVPKEGKEENEVNEPLVDTGATIVREKNNNYCMVLLANGGENIVSKYPSNDTYIIDFPFPVYSLKSVSSHRFRENDQTIDPNYNVDFRELEYEHRELPKNVRNSIADYLKKETAGSFDVTKLPMLEINTPDEEKYLVNFISCPNVEFFNEMYNADKVYVDYDMKVTSFYTDDLERALHSEIPATFVHADGIVKTNDVVHLAAVKELKYKN